MKNKPFLCNMGVRYARMALLLFVAFMSDKNAWSQTTVPFTISNNSAYTDANVKVINIPGIAGCRILIAFNSQLYLYFFGASGSPSGYAAPNLSNPTDPNQGIRFETIELTGQKSIFFPLLFIYTTKIQFKK